MMPMVSRKSSTPMPLSAWTFLNTSSTIIGFVGAAARPRCASSRPIPLAVASMMVTAAAITRLDPSLMCGPSLFLRLRAAVAARRLPTELLQAAPELLIELGAFAGVPVAPMTRFTRLVEVLADVPQLLDVFSLGDVERLERHVSERLDSRVPLHRITLDLRGDLRRRQFDRVRSRAVVLVSGRSERATDFQQIRPFRKRDRTGADLVPVLFGLRLDVNYPALGDGGADRVEDVVGHGIDHVLHQFLDGDIRRRLFRPHTKANRWRRLPKLTNDRLNLARGLVYRTVRCSWRTH